MKVILIRYSEIHLKGNNKSFFESKLIGNIKQNLKEFQYRFSKSCARYVLSDFDENHTAEILDRVKSTFGVYSVSVAESVASDINEIAEVAKAVAGSFGGTFKVVTNRADKRFPMNSMQVSSEIGGRILDEYKNLKVDLHTPNDILYIDIRENGRTFVFSKFERGVNGLPVGCSGKGVVLLSGGIDSPVACYMLAKRGMTLRAVHFHSFPFTSLQAKQKVVDLAKIVGKYSMGLTIDVVNFTEIQQQIHEKCPESYMIAIMRRFMMRIAERIAKKHSCGALITGESLGQVASQTLESLTSTNSVTTLPVLRPLIGFDKDEIIEISKRIGAFETSILPYEDCCTIFLPKNPVIKPSLRDVERYESALNVEELIEKAMYDIESILV